MKIKNILLLTVLATGLFCGCKEQNKSVPAKVEARDTAPADTLKKDTGETRDAARENPADTLVLDEDNAIPFFFEYQKGLKANRVRLTTSMGAFTVELYDNVPYHKANFIYLARKKYFDSTMFHRVVPKFIIQGGNADNLKTALKRKAIGRYLLPPDTRKGYRHHRGTLSMPSSEIDNPHMLASPFEFFIVVTDPGSYHLDGSYTPFGRVVEGMDVVDAINQVEIDDGEWPMKNVYILKAEVLE
ncbi:peptidylprolyl isomerase [Robiginitalea sp. M366]|uniref:peptidylprolyl isomerase n=1 Tax=Robiginitalea aestuariiviva TaxID=3036903 RepID=UPI00240D5AB3|nr:peptidylprolyl isomerase [Robiginitalea aestuariiviva]MDG1572574.1 peptidylprolyl isomerase [Robiginitalea aestuariiviva]